MLAIYNRKNSKIVSALQEITSQPKIINLMLRNNNIIGICNVLEKFVNSINPNDKLALTTLESFPYKKI